MAGAVIIGAGPGIGTSVARRFAAAGMPEPDPAVTSLSLGKAAVRALTLLLASEYGPAGVHVATVTVGGAVAPGGPYDPDLIAGHYWRLHTQPPQAWEHEVLVGDR